jgi:hypothetical protein
LGPLRQRGVVVVPQLAHSVAETASIFFPLCRFTLFSSAFRLEVEEEGVIVSIIDNKDKYFFFRFVCEK